MMSLRTVVKLLVSFYTGILPFLHFEEDFCEIPMGRELIKNL